MQKLQTIGPDFVDKVDYINDMQIDAIIPDNLQQELQSIKQEQDTLRNINAAGILETNEKIEEIQMKVTNLQFDTRALQNKSSVNQVILTNLNRENSEITDPHIIVDRFFQNFNIPYYIKKMIMVIEWHTRSSVAISFLNGKNARHFTDVAG
jgi:hypothetical protein